MDSELACIVFLMTDSFLLSISLKHYDASELPNSNRDASTICMAKHLRAK